MKTRIFLSAVVLFSVVFLITACDSGDIKDEISPTPALSAFEGVLDSSPEASAQNGKGVSRDTDEKENAQGKAEKEENTDFTAVRKLIENYEEAGIQAVNENDFNKVERFLVPESFIYEFQKEHIANMGQQKIKKELIGYVVKEIKNGQKSGEYDAFVYEKIKIVYPDKEAEAKEYKWIYTAAADGRDIKLKSFNIWDK